MNPKTELIIRIPQKLLFFFLIKFPSVSPGNSNSVCMSFGVVVCILKISPGNELHSASLIMEHKGYKIKINVHMSMV